MADQARRTRAAVGRAAFAGQHVAPLQNLLEQDSVHKPPSPIPGPRRCAVSVYIGPDVVLLKRYQGFGCWLGVKRASGTWVASSSKPSTLV